MVEQLIPNSVCSTLKGCPSLLLLNIFKRKLFSLFFATFRPIASKPSSSSFFSLWKNKRSFSAVAFFQKFATNSFQFSFLPSRCIQDSEKRGLECWFLSLTSSQKQCSLSSSSSSSLTKLSVLEMEEIGQTNVCTRSQGRMVIKL